MSRNHLLLLGLLAIPTVFLTEALAAERSVESFTDYAKRRIADTDADTLEAFVSAVDADSDGVISDSEFKNRVAAFQKVFRSVAPKPKSSGSHLPDGWLTDFKEAEKKAAASKKPIVVMFSASWCGPCKAMIARVYPDDSVKKTLKGFVPVYIDSEKHNDLATANDIRAYPTFVCFDSSGQEIGRKVGGGNVEAFIEMLESFSAANSDSKS